MTADRPPVKQATNAESRYEQHENQQGHRHEPAEAHPGPENEVDSLQDNELAPHQHHPEQHRRRCLTNRRRGLPEPSLDSVLGDDDDLEDRLQQDGSEQRQGEGLADHLREILHEQVEDHHVHEHVDNGCCPARARQERTVLALLEHVCTLGAGKPPHKLTATRAYSMGRRVPASAPSRR